MTAPLAGYWVDEMTSNGFEMVAVAQGPFTWSQPMREMGCSIRRQKSELQQKPRFALVSDEHGSQKSGVNNISP